MAFWLLSLVLLLLLSAAPASPTYTSCNAHIEETLAQIDQVVSESPILKHPMLQRLSTGGYADMDAAFRIFAANHYVYSRRFSQYLKIVLDSVGDNLIGAPIEENMMEESGNYEEADLAVMEKHGLQRDWFDKIPHKLLSRRFIEGVGIAVEDLGTESPGGRFTDYMIGIYSNSTACEALAVIGFAIEQTVSAMYQFVWDGLKHHTSYEDEKIVFFPLHILVDDGHAELLRDSFIKQMTKDPASCAGSSGVVSDVLARRIQSFDEIDALIVKAVGLKAAASAVSVDEAVERAKKQTASVPDPGWSPLLKMALGARILADEGHGETLAGQISCRDTFNGTTSMWTSRYGVMFGEVVETDFIMIDSNLDVQRGAGFANMATRFHLHVYNGRPDMQCIVHTHPPAVAALALTGVKLEVEHMDVMAFYEDVQHLAEWPGIPFGDEEGELISAVLAPNHFAALLAHHGLIVGGRTLEEAVYRAWFFESAARMQLDALAATCGKGVQHVRSDVAKAARDWRINDGPVRAHFNAWARKVLRNPQHRDLAAPTAHA